LDSCWGLSKTWLMARQARIGAIETDLQLAGARVRWSLAAWFCVSWSFDIENRHRARSETLQSTPFRPQLPRNDGITRTRTGPAGITRGGLALADTVRRVFGFCSACWLARSALMAVLRGHTFRTLLYPLIAGRLACNGTSACRWARTVYHFTRIPARLRCNRKREQCTRVSGDTHRERS